MVEMFEGKYPHFDITSYVVLPSADEPAEPITETPTERDIETAFRQLIQEGEKAEGRFVSIADSPSAQEDLARFLSFKKKLVGQE